MKRYRIDPRIKNFTRQRALEQTYSELALWAKTLANGDGCSQRTVIARGLAEQARALIQAFGVRA